MRNEVNVRLDVFGLPEFKELHRRALTVIRTQRRMICVIRRKNGVLQKLVAALDDEIAKLKTERSKWSA